MRITLILAVTLFCFIVAVAACDQPPYRPTPKYKFGETVKVKSYGDRGVVIRVRCDVGADECLYGIRLNDFLLRDQEEADLQRAQWHA